jgi:hypothetical protein
MRELSGFGLFVAVLGSALLVGGNIGKGQTGGALQYPPASVGEGCPAPAARKNGSSEHVAAADRTRLSTGASGCRLPARSINHIAALGGGISESPEGGRL